MKTRNPTTQQHATATSTTSRLHSQQSTPKHGELTLFLSKKGNENNHTSSLINYNELQHFFYHRKRYAGQLDRA